MSRLRAHCEVVQAINSTDDVSLRERRVAAALAEYPGDPDTFDFEGSSRVVQNIVRERIQQEIAA